MFAKVRRGQMRKFALGILSVFILLGGVLLGACQKQVSLSVSTNEVVIYTNDSNQENYQSKEIEVSVENSNLGIGVQIDEGDDCVEIEKTYTTKTKGNGKYAFKILTKANKNSGQAKITTYSLDDPTKSETISVSVKTILERLTTSTGDIQNSKSDRFVVRGEEKKLSINDYFEPDPFTANVADIDWSFEEQGTKALVSGGETVAIIEGDTLLVKKGYAPEKIVIRATFIQNTSITSTVELSVIDTSTIKNLTMHNAKIGRDFYVDGQVVVSAETFSIKRNNHDESKLEGTIAVNTTYSVQLGIDVYEKSTGRLLDNDEMARYFSFDSESMPAVGVGTTAYAFTLDAFDNAGLDVYGDFEIFLTISYDDYAYSVRTDDISVTVKTEYAAERIDIKHNGTSISEAEIFSSYNNVENYSDARGFSLVSIVERSDIVIDNNYYRFSIDTQQASLRQLSGTNPISQLASFTANGRALTFSQVETGSSVYVSDQLISKTEVFILARDTFENVTIYVEAMSNTNVRSSIVASFYQISTEQDLVVTNPDDSEVVPITYMSTSLMSERKLTFELKVNGISSLAGLSVESDDTDLFAFSALTLKSRYDLNDEKYVVVEFSVEAERYNFAQDVDFWFRHITGKTSEKYTISAFVPIQNASIQNFDKSSADLYIDESAAQGYVLQDGAAVATENTTNSVAKLMVEAGTNLLLNTNVYGATLGDSGITYKYLVYDKESVENDLKTVLGYDIENDVFETVDLDKIAKIYAKFENLPADENALLHIDERKLQLTNNEFQWFICVQFSGYDEEHMEKTLIRFFAIESFFSVKYLSSNVSNKLLYTTTSLSEKDMSLSYVDVILSLRPDGNYPTYAGENDKHLERLTLTSASNEWTEGSSLDTYFDNGYYMVSGITFSNFGRAISFKITANSTNLQTTYRDLLTISYRDGTNLEKKTEIQIEIKNAKRIESVVWVNKTLDETIYLNNKSNAPEAQTTTISTSVLPSDANDISLSYEYSGSSTDFSINSSVVGQTINLTINKKAAGTGYLYIFPTDMIKVFESTSRILLYKYTENDTIETPNYQVRVSDIDRYYHNIVTGEGDLDISPYFLNNDGERVYYSDIILRVKIVVADGSNPDLALRIYSQADLADLDPSLYYDIVNDITVSGWDTLDAFYGQINGNGHTIKFTSETVFDGTNYVEKKSGSFVNELYGTIKNLTFVGEAQTNVINAGFIANSVKTGGEILNCSVDGYNSGNANYVSSKFISTKPSAYVGTIAGLNAGRISNTHVYGIDLSVESAAYVGGLVGSNSGIVENSGVEFYTFKNQANSISGSATNFGGLVGGIARGTNISRSYVYDYTDEFVGAGVSSIRGGLFGSVGTDSAAVSEVFSYFKTLSTGVGSGAVVINNGFVASGDNASTVTYYTASGETPEASLTDETIWTSGENSNFSHKYLRNVLPSESFDLSNLALQDVTLLNGERYQAKAVDTIDETYAVLFNYKPTANIVVSSEKAELDAYNTISIQSLFNVAGEALSVGQAKSLVLTTNSSNVVLSTDSIKITNSTTKEFTITVYLKMNYNLAKEFTFVIVNAMPKLVTTLDGRELSDDQIILLQKNKYREVYYNTTNSIALAGTMYNLVNDQYKIEYTLSDANHVQAAKRGTTLILTGQSVNTNYTDVETYLTTLKFDQYLDSAVNADEIRERYQAYAEAVGLVRNFSVSVYEGATALVVKDATNLKVTPSLYAKFTVLMESDNIEDGLVFDLSYGEVEIMSSAEDNKTTFMVDNNLSLDVLWNVVAHNDTHYEFRVIIKVSDNCRHKVEKDYEDLILSVNALSQKDNDTYLRNVGFRVETQTLDDLSIVVYSVESRHVYDSVLYVTRSNVMLSTIAPASDAIVAVIVDPACAKMTHFTLTYTATGNSDIGTVSIARLAYRENHGFYTDSQSTGVVANGIQVNISDADRQSDGVYYFRIYVSNAFAGLANVKLTAQFYDGTTKLEEGVGSRDLTISALNQATVKVNGASTYLLAKGESATVSVAVNLDQTLYSLYLQNNRRNITLTSPTYKIVDGAKIYTAEIYAGVDATVNGESGVQDSGIFYVYATVERVINGVQEFKSSKATICLVDFALDTSATHVAHTTKKLSYNNKEYDSVFCYVNEKSELEFDYTLLPETLIYNKNDADEVEAVRKINAKRLSFENDHTYKDDDAGYYINHVFNEDTGMFDKVKLSRQLWYASSEGNVTRLYNGTSTNPSQNDYFNVTNDNEHIFITGKRTGSQLMMLRTTIYYQGIEFIYDYYFIIRIEIYTDEEKPLEIASAEQFIAYAEADSATTANYILTQDIVLENYTPVDSTNFDTFDGNGYTIHINSFKMPTESSELRLALFDTVTSNTLLKNVKVNIYSGGQITVNYKQYTDIKIAGFAIQNAGIIYNCEVVAYYDENYQSSRIYGDTGLVVKYTKGENSDPTQITETSGVEASIVAGFVVDNNIDASIVNSRVGGEELAHITEMGGTVYLEYIDLDVFVLEGQGTVAGFVATNDGAISASFAKKMQIYNKMNSVSSQTAGFVAQNTSNIQNSYVEGLGGAIDEITNLYIPYYNLTNISTMGIVAGFVYDNSGLVRNSYANIAIDNISAKSSMAAGFVYINETKGVVELCYAACEVLKADVGEMQFSGVDSIGNSLNYGTIDISYYYNSSKLDDSVESKLESGAIGINEVDEQGTFYGFSFASNADAYDGIWTMNEKGITLVSPNKIAISHRDVVKVEGSPIITVFYLDEIRNIETYERVLIKYGSQNNPFIIKTAQDFAQATGNASSTEYSYYKEFYTDTEVSGNAETGLIVSYRLVSSILMNEIGQSDSDAMSIKLRTTSKTLKYGLIDGNGFTVDNISLLSNEGNVAGQEKSFGLFAKLENSVIMNMNLTVAIVRNDEANVVGVLAGEAVDSRILAIELAPSTLDGNTHTAVKGKNIVGGVVGMLLGDSFISGVNVSSIEIESIYKKDGKGVTENAQYVYGVESNLGIRDNLERKNSLLWNIEKLSYAGAVAGFVDIYTKESSAAAAYSTSLGVGDYNVVTIRVKDAVNIYGEIVGGLFGYVGKSTMVYDAAITLNADMSLSNPSYIISKNLFAGGVIGESYGGLHAVYARYDDTANSNNLQSRIEESIYSYYNGTSSVERGQSSIFSYTTGEAGYLERTNKPLYIGGLVGYMGGGFMYVAYNKLNVVSNYANTAAVGGIVGLLGHSTTYYSLTFLNKQKSVNVLFYDVYASGDVYGTGLATCAGGIIGSLSHEHSAQSSTAFKNVLAMNYYSNAALESFDNNAMLIGGKETLTADLYLIDSYNNAVLNVKNNDIENDISLTVGGIKITDDMRVFGFVENTVKINKYTLFTEKVKQSMQLSYATMTSYFIERGWEEKYWTHIQDTLYPEINLLPKLLVIYWDQDNMDEVLDAMEKTTTIIVIRGREKSAQVDSDISDIDLTKTTFGSSATKGETYYYDNYYSLSKTINEFKGKLYSYAAYMNTDDGGKITKETVGGGQKDDIAGLIIDRQLFNRLGKSSLINGVTFYVSSSMTSSIINTANEATIRDVKIVVNGLNLTLEEQVISDGRRVAGLLTGVADSSTLINNEVRLRSSSLTTETAASVQFKLKQDSSGDNVNDARYFGILVGLATQNSSTNISLQGTTIIPQSYAKEMNTSTDIIGKAIDVAIDMSVGSYETSGISGDLFVGGIVGKAETGDRGYAKFSLGITTYRSIFSFTLGKEQKFNNVYAAGFIGCINNVNEIKFDRDTKVPTNGEKAVEIKHYATVKGDLVVGGVFGWVSGSRTESEIRSTAAFNIVTNVSNRYKDDEDKDAFGTTAGCVAIGGFAGKFGAKASVSALTFKTTIDFTVLVPEGAETNTSSLDDAIGGVVGFEEDGADLQFVNMSSKIRMVVTSKNKFINVGGVVGRTASTLRLAGAIDVKDLNDDKNSIDIEAKSANIGGFVGTVTSSSQVTSDDTGYKIFVGRVSAKGDEITFGGGIGSVQSEAQATISKMVYGGSFEYTLAHNVTEELTVGGIVGELLSCEEHAISESTSFGDIFVDYSEVKTAEETPIENAKLKRYVFGGILGSAPVDSEHEELKFVTLYGNYSLLTNYNARTTYEGANAKDYFVNALVGENGGLVIYEKSSEKDTNCYASGVVLAYQEEGGRDLAYLDAVTGIDYAGYSATTDVAKTKAEREAAGILSKLTNVISTLSTLYGNFEVGSKLNPIKYSAYAADPTNGQGGSSHGITWVTIDRDIRTTETITTTLENVALVGNGYTIERYTDTSDADYVETSYKAGFIENIQGKTIISNLLVDINVVEDTDKIIFGGVVGTMSGESTLYGVGINGSMSIGGSAQYVSGLVGNMNGGRINNCYVDADLIYRAGLNGKLTGLTYLAQGDYSTIAECYTSGMLTLYSGGSDENFDETYKLINGSVDVGVNAEIYDVYTIMELDESQLLSGTTNKTKNKISFGDLIDGYTTEVEGSDPIDHPGFTYKNNYNNDANGALKVLAYTAKNDATAFVYTDTLIHSRDAKHKWQYDKNVNYGYGTLPFGFMREAEIKVFKRGNETPDTTTGKATYSYTKFDVDDLLNIDKPTTNDNIYYEVLNKTKFEHMLDFTDNDLPIASSVGDETHPEDSTSTSNVHIVQYILRYDIDCSTSIAAVAGSTSGKLKNRPITSTNFVLDGRGHTLTNYNTDNAAVFATLKGEIRNFRVTNANVNTTINSGILADSLTGKLNNIHIEGSLSSSKNLGGVVGAMSGSAEVSLVEALVNITNSGTAISGGIVAEMKGGKIQYSSSNGIITNIQTNSNTSVGNGDGNTGSITGGIVGQMSKGTIENVYNGNSVLGGYTIDNNVSSVVGGIVGNVYTKDTDTITINQAYNLGLVGAGNYSVTSGISYAGGIFGYAYKGGGDITVTNCINDGAVQAISKVDATKFEIKLNSADTASVGPTNDPTSVSRTVTMTYNKNKSRQVYAYGIGYASDENYISVSSTSPNKTSRDNIKNDGNVGEISASATIRFNRKEILDSDSEITGHSKGSNENYDYSFYGSFALQKVSGDNYYGISGYDSYGFPLRVYMVDQIIRQYGKEQSGGNLSMADIDNDILDAYDQHNNWRHLDLLPWHWSNARLYWQNGESGPTSTMQGDGGLGHNKGNFETIKAREGYAGHPYLLQGQPVNYTESCVFGKTGDKTLSQNVGYEYQLALKNKAGYKLFAQELTDSETTILAQTVDDAIVDINASFSNDDTSTTRLSVNGTETAIILNEASFNNANAPYEVNLEYSFVVGEGAYDFNFSMEGDYNFIVDRVQQNYVGGNYNVVAKLRYAERPDVSDKVDLSLRYRNQQSVLISKSNVKYESGNTYIILEDENGAVNADDVSAILSRSNGYTGDYIVKINDIECVNAELIYPTGQIPRVRLDGLVEIANNSILQLSAERIVLIAAPIYSTYGYESGDVTFKFSDYQTYVADYPTYATSTGQVLIGNIADQVSTEGGIEFTIKLSSLLAELQRVTGSSSQTTQLAVKDSGGKLIFSYNGTTGLCAVASDYMSEIACESSTDYVYTLTLTRGNTDFINGWTFYVEGTSYDDSSKPTSITDHQGPLTLTISGLTLTMTSEEAGDAETIGVAEFIKKRVTYSVSATNVTITTSEKYVGVYTEDLVIQTFAINAGTVVYTQSDLSGRLDLNYYENDIKRSKQEFGTDDTSVIPDYETQGETFFEPVEYEDGVWVEVSVQRGQMLTQRYGDYLQNKEYTLTTNYVTFEDSTESYEIWYYLFDDGSAVVDTSRNMCAYMYDSRDGHIYKLQPDWIKMNIPGYDSIIYCDGSGYEMYFRDGVIAPGYIMHCETDESNGAGGTIGTLAGQHNDRGYYRIYDFAVYVYGESSYSGNWVPYYRMKLTDDDLQTYLDYSYGILKSDQELIGARQILNALAAKNINPQDPNSVDRQTAVNLGGNYDMYYSLGLKEPIDLGEGDSGMMFYMYNYQESDDALDFWDHHRDTAGYAFSVYAAAQMKRNASGKYEIGFIHNILEDNMRERTNAYENEVQTCGVYNGTLYTIDESKTIEDGEFIQVFNDKVEISSDGKTITATDYLKTATRYLVEDVLNEQCNVGAVVEQGSPTNNIIVADDLYLNNVIGKNTKNIVSANKSIHIITNSTDASVFKSNSGKLANTVFVSNVSLRDLSKMKDATMFSVTYTVDIDEHTTERRLDDQISNVVLYGSYRNVNFKAGTIIPDVDCEVGDSVKSSVSVNILDPSLVSNFESAAVANADKSVSARIEAKNSSNDILITGDGANGDHGKDGTRDDGMDGGKGKTGGAGGTIVLNPDVVVTFSRNGYDGIGGIGGNGENGYFKGNNYLSGEIIGRGKGGDAGSDADKTNLRKASTESSRQGFNGIGGFGRIYASANTYYRSVNEGRASAITNWKSTFLDNNDMTSTEAGKQSSVTTYFGYISNEWRAVANASFHCGDWKFWWTIEMSQSKWTNGINNRMKAENGPGEDDKTVMYIVSDGWCDGADKKSTTQVMFPNGDFVNTVKSYNEA